MHKHLSKVMKAVIQLVTLRNVIFGTPTHRYTTPCTSKSVSAVVTDGVSKLFIHICVARQARSESVKPKYERNNIAL